MSLRLATLAVMLVALGAAIAQAPPWSDSASGGGFGAVQFDRSVLDFEFEQPTSLAFGPDGRLYVASFEAIHALTLDAEGGEIVGMEEIASGLTGVLGIAFDPTAEGGPVTVYASHQEPSATDGFEGAISSFSAPGWGRTAVITGLPSSAPLYNHFTNGIAFDGEGRLLIAQGSASDGGLTDPSPQQHYWPETPLSAAILAADINAPGFDGAITYSPAGAPADDNVNQTGGDVSVFSPGHRNPYDLVVHSNGFVYGADNGAMGKITSLACDVDGGGTSVADELNLIEEGNYYGFPNRNRGRFDERQCAYRSPHAASDDVYTGPIAILPDHCSCDGIAEYTADTFGGALQGDLIYAEWGRGRISRAVLSEDGLSVLLTQTVGANFEQPLDVTTTPDGRIYVADFSDGRVMALLPAGPTATPTPPATATAAATATAPPTATPTPIPATFTKPPTFPATPTATPGGAGPGDVNCDGSINAIDAALVLQLTAGMIGSLACGENADVNGDGSADAIDAALILQFAAGLIDQLPP